MNTANTAYVAFLKDIAQECCVISRDDVTVYENYSGRGMYGEKCHGITGSDFIAIIETAASCGLTGAKYDSLGRDYIVYWPNPVFSDDALQEYGEQVDPN